MTDCAEFVSLGHPDKTADYIASHLLDMYLAYDPHTRFAMEVQIKDQNVTLAGEITSLCQPSHETLELMVKNAINEVGYTPEYAARWPEGATLDSSKIKVVSHISHQSPDIGQGVDADGWGDQGVFMGMATNEEEYGYMPKDVFFAQKIGRELYKAARNGEAPIGLDIKTLVALADEGRRIVEQVVVAAPMLPANEAAAKEWISSKVRDILGDYAAKEVVINGTGAYVTHSSVGDAGVVGRKLAVDFYGLNCPIGGGATFGKDGTKADVTLNLAARAMSLSTILANPSYGTVYTKIACCIGRKKCLVSQFDRNHQIIKSEQVDISPSKVIPMFHLKDKGVFSRMCANGLFSVVDELALSKAAEFNFN